MYLKCACIVLSVKMLKIVLFSVVWFCCSEPVDHRPLSVRLLWTRDRPVTETSTLQHLQQTNIHAPGGIRTRNPSRRAAADPRLRQLGHWDLKQLIFINHIISGHQLRQLRNKAASSPKRPNPTYKQMNRQSQLHFQKISFIVYNVLHACWITKATDTHSAPLHSNSGYAKAPPCHVIRTLPLLFYITVVVTLPCLSQVKTMTGARGLPLYLVSEPHSMRSVRHIQNSKKTGDMRKLLLLHWDQHQFLSTRSFHPPPNSTTDVPSVTPCFHSSAHMFSYLYHTTAGDFRRQNPKTQNLRHACGFHY
jgi:hypothetical protein